MKSLRVAVIQMDSQDQKEKNMEKAANLVEEAVSKGAKLVCLPENFNFIGEEKEEIKHGETIPGPTTAQLAAWARKYGIWLHGGSILEKVTGRDKHFSTTVLLDPRGEITASYRKIHLFDIGIAGGPVATESRIRDPGQEIVACRTGIGTVGLTICYDLRFCEIYRILALMGAQIVLIPSMFTQFTGEDHWEPLLKTRAIENQFFVLAPAQIGKKPHYPCHGHSMIVDPWGRVLAEANGDETSVVADLDFDEMERIRRQLPSLKNRRPTAYRWPDHVL